jgi:hypothetical protein
VQVNIRIGAGAVLVAALLAAGFWYANGRAWPLQWRQSSFGDRKIIVLYPGEKLVDGRPVAAD